MFGENKEGKREDTKKEEANKGKVETIMGSGTKVEGDIHTKGSLRIEGEVIGNIKAEGDLFVGEEGRLETEIEARNIIIAGKVEGNITALNKLEILPSGKLTGNIKTKILKIEEGALFNGSSSSLNNKNNFQNQTKKAKKEIASSIEKS